MSSYFGSADTLGQKARIGEGDLPPFLLSAAAIRGTICDSFEDNCARQPARVVIDEIPPDCRQLFAVVAAVLG
jgi:hypothetical protein